MGATNDFVSWATAAGNNCMSQSAYLANPAQQVGVQVGLADPTLYNKATRQANFIAAALAQFVANNQPNNVVDNGNQATFLAQLQLALNSASSSAGMQTITGAAHTFVAADEGLFTFRSNTGTLMLDTLPGIGPGVLPAGIVRIENGDATALYSVAVGSGATLDGVAAGYIVLGPGQQCVVQSSGTNYYTLQKPARVRLAANTSFYVDMAAGNDANEGLSATTGAWKTLQAADNWIAENVDFGGYVPTLQATGAFTAGLYSKIPFFGGLGFTINFASGASVAAAVNTSAFVSDGPGTNLTVTSAGTQTVLSCTGTLTEVGTIASVNGGHILFSGVNFGASPTTDVFAAAFGITTFNGAYTTSGGKNQHYLGNELGHIQAVAPPGGGTFVVTVTGTPAYSNAFAFINDNSLGTIPSSIVGYSGSATGVRAVVNDSSGLFTSGGANFFPGSSAVIYNNAYQYN